jgi:hypothetical protein
MLADIGHYLWDLADNWAAFMTGGLIAALFTLVERIRGKQFSPSTFIIIFLVFGFAAASFQTWRHEYAARTLAEQTISKGRNADTVRRLQDYYADAAQFYIQITDAKSDAEFQQTEKAFEGWAHGMGQWVIKNMGSGAYIRLIDSSQPAPVMKNVKPERAELILTIGIIRDNLAKFVENPAWDKP